MTIIHAIILGIVEGFTEFLPISSTAHLEVASRLLGIASTDVVKSFEIFIQLGAILAVVVVYARMILSKHDLWKKILVAFIPTGIIGFVLYKIIKHYALGNLPLALSILGIGGIIMIIIESRYKDEGIFDSSESIPYKTAFTIGLAQSLAVIPGVSRAAATILAGRMLKVKRQAIVEFSFLLAIPTMAAASGYDLLKNIHLFNASDIKLLSVGFITTFIVALLSIFFLLRYIKQHNFISFGIYRIIISIVLILFFIHYGF